MKFVFNVEVVVKNDGLSCEALEDLIAIIKDRLEASTADLPWILSTYAGSTE